MQRTYPFALATVLHGPLARFMPLQTLRDERAKKDMKVSAQQNRAAILVVGVLGRVVHRRADKHETRLVRAGARTLTALPRTAATWRRSRRRVVENEGTLGARPRLGMDERGATRREDEDARSITVVRADAATRRGRRMALGFLLAGASLAVAYLAAPIWVGLVIGTVMAFTAQPAYRWLASRFRDKRPLASLITTVIGGLMMASGATLALYVVAREILVLVALVQLHASGATLDKVIGAEGVRLVDALHVPRDTVMSKLHELLAQASAFATQAAGVLLETTTSAAATLVVSLFTMYYVLLEWPRIALRLERLLPLEPRHTRALVVEAREVARAAFIGTLGTAVVQGTFAGIGFAIAGAPQPVLWGGITVLTSFIPVVGSIIVWAGVALYLLLTGHLGAAIFDIAWGIIMVGIIADYVVRPRLAGRRGQSHPLLMLVSLIGGIRVFGLAGLVVGPVIMSLFVAIVHIYERESEKEERSRA